MVTMRRLTLVPVVDGVAGKTMTQLEPATLLKCADGSSKAARDVTPDDVVCVSNIMGFQRVESNIEEEI